MRQAQSKGFSARKPIVEAPERREGSRSEPARSAGASTIERPSVVEGVAAEQRPDPEVTAKAQRRRFTAEYKLRVLQEADACTAPGEIGALLRREGLYSSHLSKWREDREQAALERLGRKRGPKPSRNPLAQRLAEVERENAKLQRRLKQAETIIAFQKKVSEILGIPLSSSDSDGND